MIFYLLFCVKKYKIKILKNTLFIAYFFILNVFCGIIVALESNIYPRNKELNKMRAIENLQLTLGETSIKDIKIDAKSRDDVAKILKGLQHLYCDDVSREKIFALLEELIPDNISKTNGRPGMPLWQIFVMGMLRLNLSWDYDRLHGMVNEHKKIREMLCHGLVNENHYYKLQTIKDNVKLFTPETLGKINDEVVSSGHRLLNVGENDKLKTRCDSFVVKTNVH